MAQAQKNSDAIIEVRDLVVKYGDRTVLDGVSFDVRRGEVFVILGGSGSGKSTLLRNMVGLMQPHSGQIFIDGKDFVGTAGDLIRLPQQIMHGIFNKTDQPVKCLFWVTPTRKLYDLFWGLHSMKDPQPDEIVALSAKHEVVFLPPPA